MKKKTTEIIMSFTSLGSYRLNTMTAVKRHFGERIQIVSGDRPPESSIRIIQRTQLDHEIVKNYILPKSIIFQRIPFFSYLKCQVLVLDLNPRMPTSWVLLLIRRMLRRRTLLWGHAFPRLGPQSRSEILRSTMRKSSSGLIAYTHEQATQLANIHENIPVWAAPNALYPSSEFGFESETVRDSFIYVGRLHLDKKPLLLIEAFELAHRKNAGLRLIIVGDGPIAAEVERRVSTSSAAASIKMLGHLDDSTVLRALYAQAIASVSPGYVGLSVTQSLSFGVPMIISRDEPHAPELEAVNDINCAFFETDDAGSLSNKMLEFSNEREAWAKKGEQISMACADKYSVEAMVRGIVDALEGQTS